MNRKKGFTLIELMAVIGILALILLISVPKINDYIAKRKRNTFLTSARNIARQLEYDNMDFKSFEKIKLKELNLSDINDKDYNLDNSLAYVIDNEIYVNLVGKGRYEGLYVCGVTYSNKSISVQDTPCGAAAIAGAATLESKVGTTGGPTRTTDGNIRYVGANADVNNYVTFNNGETWRIIGVFTVKNADTNTNEKLIKILRDEPFNTSMSWDSSAPTVNEGKGINEWSQADLQTMLNGYYIGKESTCRYCNGQNQETCTNDCSSIVTPLSNTALDMIENVVWNTGAPGLQDPKTLESMYREERETTTGQICTSGDACNDEVKRETTWTGKVGLIYPSDYGYASSVESCTNDLRGDDSTCNNGNWLHSSSNWYWTLSPFAHSGNSRSAWIAHSSVRMYGSDASNAGGVRPVIYLKSNVKIKEGLGTSSSPYTLSR